MGCDNWQKPFEDIYTVRPDVHAILSRNRVFSGHSRVGGSIYPAALPRTDRRSKAIVGGINLSPRCNSAKAPQN